MKRRLGYLSGAPRVSTLSDAALGGPRSHVLGTIGAFESLGWEVKRFIIGDRVPRSWVGISSEQTIARSQFQALAADLLRLVMGVIAARQGWQILGKDVDWVYERFAVLQAMGWVFKKHGKLWILETNGPGFVEASDRHTLILAALAKRLELQAYRRCDYLVCVSNTLKKMILDAVEIPEDKIIVVPNGVDTSLFDPAQHKPIRLFEGFIIGYSGSLIPRQSIDLLLEAMQELYMENVPIYLTVVGDGPMREPWETYARTLGLSSRVHFVGQVQRDRVPDYVLGFDIGFCGHKELPVSPIFYSPLKMYEYMAMAVPVVASRHEDTQRVIRDGETGFLFQAGNKEQLKRVLKQAYDQRAQLHEKGQRGRQKIIGNDSWISRVSALIMYIESTTSETSRQGQI